MEKELTNEEIVKALENNLGFGIEHSGMYRICSATMDLINRQKAEIERLAEEKNELLDELIDKRGKMDKAQQEVYIYQDRNYELQKQVDELKANQVIECHGMLKGCDMVNQAVKDTAKEILQELYDQIDENTPKWVEVQIKIIAKRKGVEVD